VGVEQLSIFLENKSGGLADVVDVLARRGVNLRALSLADEADFGILRLIVDDTEAALAALKEAGAVARRTGVVAVEVPDRPGGLAGRRAALGGRPRRAVPGDRRRRRDGPTAQWPDDVPPLRPGIAVPDRHDRGRGGGW